MAKTTIEWTASVNAKGEVVPGYSYNPWWGCLKVSDGCANCYAETFAKRTGHSIWGPAATTQRRTFGDKHWQEPLKWHADAVKAGERRRVFCASMADVFEAHPQLHTERALLWMLIEQTPALDWLLLTKRPENITGMIPSWWAADGYPTNVWIGTSVENQAAADKRIPNLATIPAEVRFLSCEPLLGPVDLTPWLGERDWTQVARGVRTRQGPLVDWVIVGGESGPGARPMHPDWARSLRDQCQAAGVAFHFKQWGQYVPVGQTEHTWYNSGEMMYAADMATPMRAIRLKSKHDAGRQLDGREWNEFPEVTL